MARKRGHGEGSIYPLANGRWGVSLSLGTGAGGKRDRQTTSCETRRLAQDKLAEWKRARDLGLRLDASRITLKQLLEEWLELSVRPNRRANTLSNYRTCAHHHIIPRLGHLKLKAVTAHAIESFLQERRASGLADRTVALIVTTLNMAFKTALRWDMVSRNVMDSVPMPRVRTKRESPVVTKEQAQQIIALCREDWYGRIALLAMATGMRMGEMLGLRWQDVDLVAKQARVRGQMLYQNGVFEIGPTKTASGERVVRLPSLAVGMLRDHREEQKRLWLQGDRDLVFTSKHALPLAAFTVRTGYYRMLAKSATPLPHVRIHDLRQVMTSLLASEGTHPRVLMEMLGHSSPEVTLSVYTRALPGDLVEAAATIDRLLGGEE